MKHDKKKRRRLEKEPEARPRPSSLPKIPKLQKRFSVADQKGPSSTLKPSLKRPLPSPSTRPLQPQLITQSQVPTPSLPHPELKVKVQHQAQTQPTSKSQHQVFPTTVFQPVQLQPSLAHPELKVKVQHQAQTQPTSKSQHQVFPTTVFQPVQHQAQTQPTSKSQHQVFPTTVLQSQAHPSPDYQLHPVHHIPECQAPTRNHSDSILPIPSSNPLLPSQPLKPRQHSISNPIPTSQASPDPSRLLNPLFHVQPVAIDIQQHQSRSPQTGSLMNLTKAILTSPTGAVLSKQPRLPGQISFGGGCKPDLF